MILNHGPKYTNESVITLSAKTTNEIEEVHGDDLYFINQVDAVMVARLCVFQLKSIKSVIVM